MVSSERIHKSHGANNSGKNEGKVRRDLLCRERATSSNASSIHPRLCERAFSFSPFPPLMPRCKFSHSEGEKITFAKFAHSLSRC